MDVDILKTCTSDSSMDIMMAMTMQMEKFPEFSEPFYNQPENHFLAPNSTTAFPAFSNVNQSSITQPSFTNPPPPNSPFLLQQPMTPPPPTLHQPNAAFSEKKNSVAAMREMIFRVAVMQPIHIDPEAIRPPKRRNVKISKDPQSVAARHRRERISERIRILQRLVPGGTKMDTASMLDEAIHYVKFLKKQVQTLEQAGASGATPFPFSSVEVGFPLVSNANVNCSAFLNPMLPSAASKQMLS